MHSVGVREGRGYTRDVAELCIEAAVTEGAVQVRFSEGRWPTHGPSSKHRKSQALEKVKRKDGERKRKKDDGRLAIPMHRRTGQAGGCGTMYMYNRHCTLYKTCALLCIFANRIHLTCEFQLQELYVLLF